MKKNKIILISVILLFIATTAIMLLERQYGRYCPNDINKDGKIDNADKDILINHYGNSSGDEKYSADADINADGIINADDLSIVIGAIGTECK